MTRTRVRTSLVCAALLAASLLLSLATVHVAAQTASSSSTGPADAAEGEGGQSNEDIEQAREANAVAAHPFLELHGILNGSWFKVRRMHRPTRPGTSRRDSEARTWGTHTAGPSAFRN
jgi:hypothetical protein